MSPPIESNSFLVRRFPAKPPPSRVRGIRHRRDVALLVHDGALPWRTGDRAADFSTADADPPLYVLLFFIGHRSAGGFERKENRYGSVPPHGRPVGARDSPGVLRRKAGGLPVGHSRAGGRGISTACQREDRRSKRKH